MKRHFAIAALLAGLLLTPGLARADSFRIAFGLSSTSWSHTSTSVYYAYTNPYYCPPTLLPVTTYCVPGCVLGHVHYYAPSYYVWHQEEWCPPYHRVVVRYNHLSPRYYVSGWVNFAPVLVPRYTTVYYPGASVNLSIIYTDRDRYAPRPDYRRYDSYYDRYDDYGRRSLIYYGGTGSYYRSEPRSDRGREPNRGVDRGRDGLTSYQRQVINDDRYYFPNRETPPAVQNVPSQSVTRSVQVPSVRRETMPDINTRPGTLRPTEGMQYRGDRLREGMSDDMNRQRILMPQAATSIDDSPGRISTRFDSQPTRSIERSVTRSIERSAPIRSESRISAPAGGSSAGAVRSSVGRVSAPRTGGGGIDAR